MTRYDKSSTSVLLRLLLGDQDNTKAKLTKVENTCSMLMYIFTFILPSDLSINVIYLQWEAISLGYKNFDSAGYGFVCSVMLILQMWFYLCVMINFCITMLFKHEKCCYSWYSSRDIFVFTEGKMNTLHWISPHNMRRNPMQCIHLALREHKNITWWISWIPTIGPVCKKLVKN